MNEDILRYLDRAEEALESARILHRENHYLDAASRAYYSMYHAAMAALSTENISVKTHKGN
ncbi:MAG: HEPN domain-containing protein [Saprospirales bacterium]|nr:HEPN domain-containing protein [Saprospirales bacterium]